MTEMVGAMGLLPASCRAELLLAGPLESPFHQENLASLPGWDRVKLLGWQTREGIADMLVKCRVGLCVLHPTPNHVNAYPVKLFEYMAAGLPVIASSFPLWKKLVEGNHCGLTVDPLDPEAISGAIQYLLEHPEAAQQMGESGRRAVEEVFSWSKEGEKLVRFYNSLLDGRSNRLSGQLREHR